MLKQRLVGAIVLVALAVIFIPMLLEEPDRDLVPQMDSVPESAGEDFPEPLSAFPPAGEVPEEPAETVVRETPETGEDGSETAAVAEESAPAPEAGSGTKSQKQETPSPPPSAEHTASRPQEPRAEPAPAAENGGKLTALGSWVVQVGSFSSRKNALGLRDRLRKAGFATQVEKVRVKGKVHYRVRVGPFLERTAAERARSKLVASGLSPGARVLARD